MATIKEDYVSFEIAKLLKEKGFDEYCSTSYNSFLSNHKVEASNVSEWGKANQIYRPTQAMAMKWLREIHNIHIAIIPCEVGPGVMDYTYALYKIDAKNFYFKDLGIQGRAENISKISYEETCEAAIKYCLENLI